MRFLTIFLAAIILIACRKQNQDQTKPEPTQHPIIINIALKNAFTNALNGVEIEWAGPAVSGGILSPGIVKTDLSVTWPNLPSAKVNFLDDRTRKAYSLLVPLDSVNRQLESGSYRQVTFRILSYEKAEAVCEE